MGALETTGFFSARVAVPARRAAALAPGTAVAIMLALVALLIARLTILPAVLVGLLLGMLVAPAADGPRLNPGLAFSARRLLRIGVALLGARVTLGEMVDLGAGAAAISVGGLVLCLVVGYALARALRLSIELAFLTATAVAICGASATLAVAAVLPKSASRDHNAAATVAAITVVGTVAMVAWPFVALALGLDARESGIFYGATLHEVVQAVGAGFTHGPVAGEVATTVKLARVACLAPVVMMIGWWAHRSGGEIGGRPPLLPLFLVSFLIFAGLASLGLLPEPLLLALAETSRFLLLVAIVALGSKIAPRQLREFGWRPLFAISAQSLAIAAFALAAILLLYR